MLGILSSFDDVVGIVVLVVMFVVVLVVVLTVHVVLVVVLVVLTLLVMLFKNQMEADHAEMNYGVPDRCFIPPNGRQHSPDQCYYSYL